jgi:hypothetical protein
MDWSQTLYLALIIVASGFCRDGRIAAVMWANFVCTMALAGSPALVATVDLLSICFLVGRNPRRNIVATIFVFMVPIYGLGEHFAWGPTVTYSMIDALAFAQLFIMGRGDVGLGNLGRHLRGRRDRGRGDLEAGAAPARRVAGSEADHR